MLHDIIKQQQEEARDYLHESGNKIFKIENVDLVITQTTLLLR